MSVPLFSHAALKCLDSSGMSMSTVERHKFGWYSYTRSMLSTSNTFPVPVALIRATGLSSAILEAEFKQHVGIVVT